MTSLCLFCNSEEPGYKSEQRIEFICGSCVQVFLAATPDQVKAVYKKAADAGYSNKARALGTI